MRRDILDTIVKVAKKQHAKKLNIMVGEIREILLKDITQWVLQRDRDAKLKPSIVLEKLTSNAAKQELKDYLHNILKEQLKSLMPLLEELSRRD